MATQLTYGQDIYIIIHGTWAQNATWHKPGGDFFEQLNKVAAGFGGYVQFLIWPGKNSHEAREKGAQQLISLMETFDAQNRFFIIGHSHGGNVAILASQILQKTKSKYSIYKLFSLATPVNTTHYTPDMSKITYLYHFISYTDMIQPVFGLFEREFPEHERIVNIRTLLEGNEIDHAHIHDPLIAKWLVYMHQDLKLLNASNFERFTFGKPALVNFTSTTFPQYAIDTKREELREIDKYVIETVNNAFRQTDQTKNFTPLLP